MTVIEQRMMESIISISRSIDILADAMQALVKQQADVNKDTTAALRAIQNELHILNSLNKPE